jgi:aminoglycoside phosphotransferase (APT) family kinase protein
MTPALIAFDDSCEILPVPYTLMERVHAVPLSVDELESDSDVLAELGRQLAILHGKVTSCPDPNGWLDPIDTLDGSLIVRDIDEAAGVDQSRRTAASELVARLSDLIAAHDEARVFSHGDVHVRNVLGAPQRLAALIDWGDAGWGHPAFDFAHLPMRLIPAVLGGYEREAPASFPCLRQAITLAHLVTAARHMGRPRTPRYRETGLQELDDVLAFVGDAGPEWA